MPFKEFKFEFKIILLLVLGLILVSIIGFATYNRLTRLFDSVHSATRPDMGLVLTHVVQADVNDLSILVKSKIMGFEHVQEEDFTLKKQDLLNHLYAFKQFHEKGYNVGVVKIDSLIHLKMSVADELFYSENTHRVQTALSKVEYSIDESLLRSNVEPMKLKETVVIKERVNEEKLSGDNQEKTFEEEKKRRKLFGNKKEKAKQDSILNIAKQIKADNTPIVPKSYETVKVVDTLNKGKVSYKKVYDGIKKVREEEIEIENRLKDSHLDLLMLEEGIDRDIQAGFEFLKKVELQEIKEATDLADLEARKTWKQIVILTVFIIILLFVLGGLILQFARRSKLYQIAIKRSAQQSKDFVLAKERFMSNFSHELRTPMHAIQGFAELLSKESLEGSQKTYVEMIQKSTQHMGYLLNDVLDLAKLRNHKLRIIKSPLNVHELISEVWQYAKQLNRRPQVEMNLRLSIKEDLVISMDTYRLRQILLNLLSNAIKFTEQGNVTLLVEQVNQGGVDSIRISVQDSGIGMTQKETLEIFEEYVQARAEISHQYGGTGLGLSITKKLIDLLGGKISVVSEKGVGTSMTVTLPFEEVETQQNAETSTIRQDKIVANSVLVIDDELYNRKYLEGILQNSVQQLYFADSAEAAQTLILDKQIDLILLDYRLPGMNGREFVEWMNTFQLESRPKVIILSAAIDDEQYDELLSIKVDSVIGKPFSSQKLFSEINRVLAPLEQSISVELESEDNANIDFGSLKEIIGQDVPFYKDMLETYLISSDESIATMKLALSQNDYHLMGHEAHKIASPSKHIGANELYKLLKEIETNASISEDVSLYNSLLKQIEYHYQFVKGKIHEELNQLNQQ